GDWRLAIGDWRLAIEGFESVAWRSGSNYLNASAHIRADSMETGGIAAGVCCAAAARHQSEGTRTARENQTLRYRGNQIL
ncbi:MAG TPA: hypothetical protein VEL79_04610, partial [Vicinamibacterales bacterium]|nr:hypothetical protein [Vicinamibacterales bacterium]